MRIHLKTKSLQAKSSYINESGHYAIIIRALIATLDVAEKPTFDPTLSASPK